MGDELLERAPVWSKNPSDRLFMRPLDDNNAAEQIEDILVMFSEMGVNVVETKEAEPEETPEDAQEEPEGKKATVSSRKCSARPR
jgi:hypothetical protein